MGKSEYTVDENVAVITFNSPPVNALGLGLRQAIMDCLQKAANDPDIAAVVLIGSDRMFSGGADIHEMGKPEASQEPVLPTIIQTMDGATKPIVAAIGGICMGGGLELAMGAHFRIATASAKLALPEVKLGILPGAGGTQRLPRAIGLEPALDFILKGDPVAANAFHGTPLIDVVVDDDLAMQAIDFAKRLVSETTPLRRIRDLETDHPNYRVVLKAARDQVSALSAHYPAPNKIIDCLEAAVEKPFDQGLRFERESFLELRETSASRAMRYAFAAERECSKIPDLPKHTETRDINRVGVIGAGTMGRGISINFLNVGIPVTLLETKQEALDLGVTAIRTTYESGVKRGRLSQNDLDGRMSLLTATLDYDDLADLDMVIEAVFEDIGVKETVFRKLDQTAKPGAILASNTSTLDVDKIASFTRRPEDVIGTHFFSPANIMRLLEVVRGDKTANDVLATVMKLGKTINKTAVVSGVCDGFIGNRMVEHYVRMAGFMVEWGATPRQVDQALESWGMIMGPFRMGDLAGNDIGWAIRKRRYVEKPHVRYAKVADKICERGRFGQKTGKGWYLYREGDRTPVPDPEVEEIIADYRREAGIEPRDISDQEIVEHCIYALINEGARILEEGIALRASDIDVVYLTGYGFPRFRGGPMRFADEIGLEAVAKTMERLEKSTGDAFWQPAAIIKKLIDQGGSFTL